MSANVTVLGYIGQCEDCGSKALLDREMLAWVCPACAGSPDPDDDPMGKALQLVGEFLDVLRRLRPEDPEGGVLDTVAALDDEDPEAVRITPPPAQ